MELHLRAAGHHLSWDRTVLPSTRHKWTHPALTPARQASTGFTYPGGMEGWVDLGDWLHAEMVHPPTDWRSAIQSTNPAVHDRDSNSRPVDHKSDALTTTLPSEQMLTFSFALNLLGMPVFAAYFLLMFLTLTTLVKVLNYDPDEHVKNEEADQQQERDEIRQTPLVVIRFRLNKHTAFRHPVA